MTATGYAPTKPRPENSDRKEAATRLSNTPRVGIFADRLWVVSTIANPVGRSPGPYRRRKCLGSRAPQTTTAPSWSQASLQGPFPGLAGRDIGPLSLITRRRYPDTQAVRVAFTRAPCRISRNGRSCGRRPSPPHTVSPPLAEPQAVIFVPWCAANPTSAGCSTHPRALRGPQHPHPVGVAHRHNPGGLNEAGHALDDAVAAPTPATTTDDDGSSTGSSRRTNGTVPAPATGLRRPGRTTSNGASSPGSVWIGTNTRSAAGAPRETSHYAAPIPSPNSSWGWWWGWVV